MFRYICADFVCANSINKNTQALALLISVEFPETPENPPRHARAQM